MSEAYQRADRQLELARQIRAHVQQQGETCELWVSMTVLANDLEISAWNDMGCDPFRQIK
jgi:hypothetical protein